MKLDKDKIKNSLSIEQVEDIVAELGGEPRPRGNILVCKTICHGGESHKLYYYDNSKLFRCFTECDDSFDIFDLIIKVHELRGEKCSLYNAMLYVVNFFSLNFSEDNKSLSNDTLNDWDLFKRWEKNNLETKVKKVEIKTHDKDITKNLPTPHILNWEREGIKKEICDARHICYDPSSQSIIIPHYNEFNQLIGIRGRTLIKENEAGGKYRPAIFNGQMWNHPLGFNLYNLNFSKKNIINMKKAIVFQGEKSCLLFASYFGVENDISVACCGSNLTNYQFSLLQNLGISELIIAFDRQYREAKSSDKEWQGWTKKLQNLYSKYGKYVQISYIFDKNHLLDYKDSPIDKGKDIFFELYEKRLFI